MTVSPTARQHPGGLEGAVNDSIEFISLNAGKPRQWWDATAAAAAAAGGQTEAAAVRGRQIDTVRAAVADLEKTVIDMEHARRSSELLPDLYAPGDISP